MAASEKLHGILNRVSRSMALTGASLSLVMNPLVAQAQAEKVVKEDRIVTVKSDDKWEAPEKSAPSPWTPHQVVKSSGPERLAAPADDDQFYPESALRAAYEAEMREMKKTEEVERSRLQYQSLYEKKKSDAQDQLVRHKREIFENKLKQEKAAEDIELMQADLKQYEVKSKSMQEASADAEDKARQQMLVHGEERKRFENSQAQLEKETKKLYDLQDRVQRTQVEIEKLRSQIGKNESAMLLIENDKMRLESEELEVRNNYTGMAARNREIELRKKQSMTEVADMTRKLEQSRNDFFQARRENERLERELVSMTQKSNMEKAQLMAEMKRLDDGMKKMEAERIRNDAEKEHIGQQVAQVRDEMIDARKKHMAAQSEMSESNAVIMESRLALDQAKSDLVREYAQFEGSNLRNENRKVKMRNLASLAEASDMLNEQVLTRAVKGCPVRREPSSVGPVVSQIKEGTKLIAAPAEGGWYKILNTSGAAQYVDQTCLKPVN